MIHSSRNTLSERKRGSKECTPLRKKDIMGIKRQKEEDMGCI